MLRISQSDCIRAPRRGWGRLLLFLGCPGAFSPASTAALRETISLNTGWRFMRQTNPGSGVEWELRDAWKPDFDDSRWTTVFVPHSWDQSAHNPWVAANHWRGIGWYRKEFTAPQSAAGRKVFLEFEGVFQVTEVRLNGKLVGEHTGGFTGFFVDVMSPRTRAFKSAGADSNRNAHEMPPSYRCMANPGQFVQPPRHWRLPK